MTSGRVADAISSLLEWLGKAEASLAEDQPTMGDTDTIHMLIEQHKVGLQPGGGGYQDLYMLYGDGIRKP